MTEEMKTEQDLITVCAECLQASCWQGVFMCDKSRFANIVQKTRAELREQKREHSDYWKTDEELASVGPFRFSGSNRKVRP